MADTKITALTANTDPLVTDIMPLVDDPGGSAATQKATILTLQGVFSAGMLPGGRLTLTTGTPVTTADVTGGTTLYYTPYLHDNIRLYDGTTWRTVSFTEKSITLVGTTASKPYDVFGYLSAGTLALELLIWTNATTRATALAYQNGRLVKSGVATRLYLGTIYINASGGQTDSSVTKRFVWNYYNRVGRILSKNDATQHNYATGTWRSWNGDATQIVEFVIGVSESPNELHLLAQGNTGNTAQQWLMSMGYDVTNAELENYFRVNGQDTTIFTAGISAPHLAAAGYHYYSALEYAVAGSNSAFLLYHMRVLILG